MPDWQERELTGQEQIQAILWGLGLSSPDRPSPIERRFMAAMNPDNLAELGRAFKAFGDGFKDVGKPGPDHG